MESRNKELNFTPPSREEIEFRVRQAEQMRAEMLAQGAKWVFRQISAGLHWLFGLQWRDAERLRQERLKLRYARASSASHIEPGPQAPEVPVGPLPAADQSEREPIREDRRAA
jgi:hypothetical protein